ncbi:MAG: alpha/beta hydrolase [Polyangiales bacterium]
MTTRRSSRLRSAGATTSLLWIGAVGACSPVMQPPTDEASAPSIPLSDWRRHASFTEVGGHRLAYWEAGDPRREAIVLIHGFPSAAWDWQHLWNPLAEDYHVIAIDLLGFGYSDKPKDHAYTMSEQADMVLGVVRQLNVVRFHVIAHDYGVTVAQEILARHRDGDGFLASLCLLNGGVFPEAQHHPILMKLLKGPLGTYLVKLQSKERFTQRLSAVFGPKTRPMEDHLDGYWSLLTEQRGVNAIPALIQYIDERHLFRDRWVGALEATDVPVRLIVGTFDEISGENMVRRYEQVIEDPDIVRLPDIGHYPQLEAPHQVLAAYRAFMQAIHPALDH